MKRLVLPLAVVALSALSACGEKPQTLGSGVKTDGPAYQGVQNPFAAPGWKAGDKTSWEQGLKARAQNSQNEYNKIGSSK
jgi:major membrane immunogen (membrane-anchored lipoprotein)